MHWTIRLWRRRRLIGLVAFMVGTMTVGGVEVTWLGRPAWFDSSLRHVDASQESPAESEDVLHPISSTNDAVESAAADARVLVAAGRGPELPFFWWVWVQSGEEEDAAVVQWTANKIARSPFLHPGVVVKTTSALLVRLDLRDFFPQPNDLNEALKIREDFAFDPSFSLLVTNSTIKLLNIPTEDMPRAKKKVKRVVVRKEPYKRKVKKQVTVKLAQPYIDQYGRYHDTTVQEQEVEEDAERDVKEEVEDTILVPLTEAGDFAVVRLNSRAINRDDFGILQDLTGTEAPVVKDRYFLSRALTTIKDADKSEIFATIYGGRYYDLRGIRRSKDPKKTDLILFLEDLGLIDADKFFERQRSDQRVAMAHSQVTDKVRRVDLERSPSGRETTGWLAITHDFFDANSVDPAKHPIMNLLRVDADAFEVRAEGPNGTIKDAIFDGKQKLLDEAGADIVAAHNHPFPHTRRLQSAFDCEICHAEASGWQPLTNDVKTMLLHGFTPFGDLSALEKTVPDVRDRLLGLYAGSFDLQLSRARDDQERTFLIASGVNSRGGPFLWADDPGQTQTVKHLTDRLGDLYKSYNYGTVDAKAALYDLGVHAPSGKALETLQALLPPDPDSRIGLDRPEDPRIGMLLSGISIGVRDWQAVESFVAVRVQKNLLRVMQHPPKN